MAFKELQALLSAEAADIKENLMMLSDCAGLTKKQTAYAMLASSFIINNSVLTKHIVEEIDDILTNDEKCGVKVGAILMGMNNTYFRFAHMTGSQEIQKLRPNLKMKGLKTHGLPENDFEIVSLASSCIGNCEHCINWHVTKLLGNGFSFEAVQSVGRIAAVLKGVDVALSLTV